MHRTEIDQSSRERIPLQDSERRTPTKLPSREEIDAEERARAKERERERERERNRVQLGLVSSHFLLPIFHSAPEERGVDPYLSSSHKPSPDTLTFRRTRDESKTNAPTRRPPSLERRSIEALRGDASRREAIAGKQKMPDKPAPIENSKWIDFHFAQRLLDLIDDILLLPVSTPPAHLSSVLISPGYFCVVTNCSIVGL